eukprot:gnl/TRDRNA2_/TRDRNA2_165831_c0_seq4.p1 gnl/TRDRNA2_/TRDRNA2_165831_c0~~gnl/TRDRNA2_/TRDRNA2_165831_c0_seq4.p1  ORF type:complete len:121 (-),score=22.06 gnl/TRDRNA2_/TRDRNA2_165831_c0_seq4:87-449(-)
MAAVFRASFCARPCLEKQTQLEAEVEKGVVIHEDADGKRRRQGHDEKAALVCMVPRSMAAPEVLAKRHDAAKRGISTTHRPYVFQPTYEYSNARSVKDCWHLCPPECLRERSPAELALVG